MMQHGPSRRELPSDIGLGSRRDVDIAAEMGVSRERVRQWRKQRGIPPFPERHRRDCRKADKIDWTKLPLGAVPDREIARQTSLCVASIIGVRRRLGIPGYAGHREKMGIKGISWDELPLGKIPDAQIAKMAGTSHVAVLHARKKRKIPSWRSTKGGKSAARASV